MKILICSDGMPPADTATRIGGLLAAPLRAEVVLLGIAERPQDEQPLRAAIQSQANSLQQLGVTPVTEIRNGEPVRQILEQTTAKSYDLVVIGSRRTGAAGLYWRSAKTYEVIKSIAPPVLVATGDCEQLKRFLVCTGGKQFIEEAVDLTGKLAGAIGASVTLLHVLAEPPAIYADLVRLEEDVDQLLESKSELGVNLARQKKSLEALGVATTVRLRHGIVTEQVFAELRSQPYDLIVTGSSRARGMVRHYIMGDVTRSILNHASCPVLVARAGELHPFRGFWRSLRHRFASGRERAADEGSPT